MTWSDERISQLRTLWSQGRSASEIAVMLGDGISRNAVIGKAHRLGLSSRPSPIRRTEKQEAGPGIMALNERMCRWPVGDPRDEDFHFCGKASVPGLPYCGDHCRTAYQPTRRRFEGEESQPLPTVVAVTSKSVA